MKKYEGMELEIIAINPSDIVTASVLCPPDDDTELPIIPG